MSAIETVARFQPEKYREFRFLDWTFDEPSMRLQLRYGLDDELTFCEEVDFRSLPAPRTAEQRAALNTCFQLLHLFAGTSYYKCAAPPTLAVSGNGVSAAMAELATSVFCHGLAEFAWQNQLDHVRHLEIEGRGPATLPQYLLAESPQHATLVPLGGGKDSLVTLETLLNAGMPVIAVAAGEAGPMRAAARTAGVDLFELERKLDPQIFALSSAGAYNGHVPVTAVNSVLACIAAILMGCGAVAMSNERSASVGSLSWNGTDVNHQWSKGREFEELLATFIHSQVAGDLDYFSLLRPLSELAICKTFATMPKYFAEFVSCNRYFRRQNRTTTWCGECDKCRFVFLALAPWIAAPQLVQIFGQDLLSKADTVDKYRELAGLVGQRPFDCVGEEVESRAAFMALTGESEFANSAVVRAVRPEVAALAGSENFLTTALTPDNLPLSTGAQRYWEILYATL